MPQTLCKGLDDEVFQKAHAGDNDAIAVIMAHNHAMVLWQAKKFSRTSMTMEERVHAGTYGLFRACLAFDPNRGLQFSTYAVTAIWSQLQRASAECANFCSYSTVKKYKARGLECPHKQFDGFNFDMLVTPRDTSLEDDDERQNQLRIVNQAMDELSPTEREVITRRCLSDETLQQVGDAIHLTKERVRQIQNAAIAKIRRAVGASA